MVPQEEKVYSAKKKKVNEVDTKETYQRRMRDLLSPQKRPTIAPKEICYKACRSASTNQRGLGFRV